MQNIDKTRLLIITKLLWIEDTIVDNKLRLIAKTKKIQHMKRTKNFSFSLQTAQIQKVFLKKFYFGLNFQILGLCLD